MTVKVPGKRPPRAVAPVGPSPVPPGSVPGVNGLNKDLTAADGTSTGRIMCLGTCNTSCSNITEELKTGEETITR